MAELEEPIKTKSIDECLDLLPEEMEKDFSAVSTISRFISEHESLKENNVEFTIDVLIASWRVHEINAKALSDNYERLFDYADDGLKRLHSYEESEDGNEKNNIVKLLKFKAKFAGLAYTKTGKDKYFKSGIDSMKAVEDIAIETNTFTDNYARMIYGYLANLCNDKSCQDKICSNERFNVIKESIKYFLKELEITPKSEEASIKHIINNVERQINRMPRYNDNKNVYKLMDSYRKELTRLQ